MSGSGRARENKAVWSRTQGAERIPIGGRLSTQSVYNSVEIGLCLAANRRPETISPRLVKKCSISRAKQNQLIAIAFVP
jgi:hypothetical protein